MLLCVFIDGANLIYYVILPLWWLHFIRSVMTFNLECKMFYLLILTDLLIITSFIIDLFSNNLCIMINLDFSLFSNYFNMVRDLK